MICPAHEEEEDKGPRRFTEALAVGGTGPVSWKTSAADPRACRGHEACTGGNPCEPRGPAADRIWGNGAQAAEDPS